MLWRDLIGLLRPGSIAGGDNGSIFLFSGSVGRMPSPVRAHWRTTVQLDRCATHTLDKSTEANSGPGREALWHSHLDSSEKTARMVFTTCQMRGNCAQHLCLRVLLPMRIQCETNAKPQCETHRGVACATLRTQGARTQTKTDTLLMFPFIRRTLSNA